MEGKEGGKRLERGKNRYREKKKEKRRVDREGGERGTEGGGRREEEKIEERTHRSRGCTLHTQRSKAPEIQEFHKALIQVVSPLGHIADLQ